MWRRVDSARMKQATTSVILILIGFSGFLTAQERTEESFIPNYAVAGSYFSWGGESDVENGAGTFQNLEYGAEANIPVFMREGFRMTAGVKYRHNTFDFSGAPLPFASTELDLQRIDIPINAWIDLGQRWKFWARLQPGWASDFNNLTSDDFTLSSLALLSYKWNATTKVAFGAYYSRDLGEERILPALGFIFEPGPQLSLALTFPRAQLVYAPSPDCLISSQVLLNGAGWNITDPAGGSEDVDLNYRAIRAGFGFDRRLRGPVWGYVDGGFQFGQEIEMGEGANSVKLELDPSPYATTGIKVRF